MNFNFFQTVDCNYYGIFVMNMIFIAGLDIGVSNCIPGR